MNIARVFMAKDRETRHSETQRKVRLDNKKHRTRKMKAKRKRFKDGSYNTDMRNRF